MSLVTARAIYKSSIVRLSVAAAVIAVAFFYRRQLNHWFHVAVWRIPASWSRHPALLYLLHVLRNITPDMSSVLLALAGLSYLMPEVTKRIESSKALRRTVAIVLIFFGVSVIVLNEVGREDQEEKEKANSDKLESVSMQNGQILQAVLADRTVPEVERRKRIESTLRNEYILSHSNISPAMLAGTDFPPASWMNERLHQLGEKWTFEELPARMLDQAPRSYIVFDRLPSFPKETLSSSPRDFRVGDQFSFDVYYKATGPNAVELVSMARALYIEPDYKSETQEAMISFFIDESNKEKKASHSPPKLQTMTPAEESWMTIYAFTPQKGYRIVTQDDLGKLRIGTEVAFLIVEVTYKDRGVVHHQRKCEWLQPPALQPGVWHFCEVFNASD